MNRNIQLPCDATVEAFEFQTEDLEPAGTVKDASGAMDCELRAEELEPVIAPGMRLQHNETFLL
jgi:hypothetical protein